MSLPVFNFREFTVSELKECLNNAGYLTNNIEFEVAEDGAFKFIGCSNGTYRYLVGFESTVVDEEYLVSTLFVSLGNQGLMVAEYGGCPVFEGSYDGMMEFIENKCN